jgi:hypothetical protein
VERNAPESQALLSVMTPSLLSVLCALYASEINISICVSSSWDEGWEVKLGDTVQGFRAKKTFANAELDKVSRWLAEQSSLLYPETDFARRFSDFKARRHRRSRAAISP